MKFYKFTENENSLLRKTVLGKNVREKKYVFIWKIECMFSNEERKNKQKNSKTWIDLGYLACYLY